jgi:hypothetical protein
MTDTFNFFVDAITRASSLEYAPRRCAWNNTIANMPHGDTDGRLYVPELLVRNACIHFVSVHGSAVHPRKRGDIRFFQLLGALFAAHLNRFTANADFDGIRIEIAVASRARFFNHDITLQYPKWGKASRPRGVGELLSESLAICWDDR